LSQIWYPNPPVPGATADETDSCTPRGAVPRRFGPRRVGQVVKDVEGISVRNLRRLVELLRDGRGEYLTIRFFGGISETLVFPRRAIEDSTPELMRDNGIHKRGTDDVMAIWDSRAVRP
jgi:hypothetical protein